MKFDIKFVFVFLLIQFHLQGQLRINEIMVNPGNLSVQGLIGGGREYIEIYNSTCNPINTRGYYIATSQNVSGTNRGGTFRIPNIPQSIIAPNSHLVLGTRLSSSDSNSIDIKLPNYMSNVCELSSGTFVMANFDGWIALYDSTGTPISAVYWGANASIISQTSDFGIIPCVPPGSPTGLTLKSAIQINTQNPGVLQYGGGNPSIGQTHSRIPDGGNWSFPQTATINHVTGGANANCNGGTCNTIGFNFIPTVTQPTCGNSNGSISIATSPSSTKTYTWSSNANTGNNSIASNLSAGSYTVTVNQNGCIKDTTIVLTTTSKPVFSITTTQPTCTNTLGAIAVNVSSSGTPSFNWSSNASTGNSSNANNLSAGMYTVTVTQNGCTKDTSIQLNSAIAPTISPTIINATCGNSNGSISLTISPAGTNIFSWSTNANTGNNANANNLAAGTYSVTVTQNGCTKDTTLTVTTTQVPTISSSIIHTSCGQNNGLIALTISPIGTNNFSWSTNANTGNNDSAINLAAGTYSVTVTQNGCTASQSNTINASNGLSLNITKTNDNCSQGIGSISISMTSIGTPSFAWSTNANTGNNAIASNLTSGNYSVTVTQNGCTKDTTITLFNSSSSIVFQKNVISPTCGLSNGSISLNVTSSGATSFNWSTNANTGNLATANGLKSGNYSVTVSQNGCSSDTTFSLLDPFNPVKDTIRIAGCNQLTYKSTSYSSNTFLIDTLKKTVAPFCDSIYRRVEISISKSDTTDLIRCVLSGQNYSFYSQSLSNSGIYFHKLTNIKNCDSIIKLTLNVITPLKQAENKVGCNEFSYKNILYFRDTTLLDTIKNTLGCDSVHQALSIKILRNDTTSIEACSNSNYNFFTRTISSSGTYFHTISRSNKCDSIIRLNLTILNAINKFEDTFVCSNSIISNIVITKDTSIKTKTILSRLGCDSVLTFLRITVNKPILKTGSPLSGCDSVIYKGKKYIQNTSVIDTIRKKITPFCDSMFTSYSIIILPKVSYSKQYSPDSTMEQGERVTLKINGGSSYQWSTSSTSNNIIVSPLKSTTYYVTITSPNECSAKDSFKVIVKEVPSDVVLPNIFSPNGDNLNDRYSAKVIGKAQITSFKIFNRWGEKVYEGSDNFSSWNGTYKGEEAPIGIYIYVVEYKLFEKFYTLKGSLSLIK